MSTTKKPEEQLVMPTATEPAQATTTQPAQQTAPQPAAQTTTTQPAQTTTAQPAQQTTTQPAAQTPTNDVNALLNLRGISDGTKQALGNLVSNGYQPSENVTKALNDLQGVIAQQPAAFQSAHMTNLNNILNQIMGRQSFTYDMANDPFYQQYRTMYMNAGRQAMSDTVGQSSALTGGYGNSWASTAGQQQYNQYLQQLNDRVPELQQMALDKYNAEGDQLMNQYALLGDAYDRERTEYEDAYNKWLAERDYLQGAYETERGYDYDAYNNAVNNWFTTAGMEQDQFETDRGYAYDLAMTMIGMGKMPSDQLLLNAGLSAEDIAALKKSSGGSSSGSGKSSSGSGSATTSANIGSSKSDVGLSMLTNTLSQNAAASNNVNGMVGKSTGKASAEQAATATELFKKHAANFK